MSVEILTVSLSDESIGRIASEVARILGHNPTDSLVNPSPTPQRTQPAENRQEEADPWAGEGPTDGRGAQPAASATTGSPAAGDGEKVIKTKNGVQVWSFPPNAPKCDCGQPAGFCKWTTQAGKPAKAYKCAKDTGSDWRNKCEFFQYVR